MLVSCHGEWGVFGWEFWKCVFGKLCPRLPRVKRLDRWTPLSGLSLAEPPLCAWKRWTAAIKLKVWVVILGVCLASFGKCAWHAQGMGCFFRPVAVVQP